MIGPSNTFKPLLEEWFNKRYSTPRCPGCGRKMPASRHCKPCREKHEKPKAD